MKIKVPKYEEWKVILSADREGVEVYRPGGGFCLGGAHEFSKGRTWDMWPTEVITAIDKMHGEWLRKRPIVLEGAWVREIGAVDEFQCRELGLRLPNTDEIRRLRGGKYRVTLEPME